MYRVSPHVVFTLSHIGPTTGKQLNIQVMHLYVGIMYILYNHNRILGLQSNSTKAIILVHIRRIYIANFAIFKIATF